MFNDYLANEEAKQHIQRRLMEADEFRLQRRLGTSGHKVAQWIICLLLILAVAIVLALGSV